MRRSRTWLVSVRAAALAGAVGLWLTQPAVALAAAPVPDASCSQEASLKSTSGTTRFNLRFVNRTMEPLQTFWLDYTGKRVFFRQVAGGAEYSQPTWVTHPWVFADTSGRCLKLFVTDGLQTAVIVGAESASQPSYAANLRSPAEVSWKTIDVLRSAALAAGLIVLIGFPGQLFNSTLMSNYAEVMGWFGFLRRFRRPKPRMTADEAAARAAEPAPSHPALGAPPWQVLGVFLLSAFIGGFLDPNFGRDLSSVQTMLGILLATVITTFVYTGTHAVLMHRLYGVWGHWQIFPGGIAIVLICVAIAKFTSAEPGYIYGVMLSYSLGAFKVPEKHEGRLVAAGYLLVLAASLGAWLLWSPVKAAASSPAAALPIVILSSALAGIFIGGICSMVFGLIPLRFLDGQKLLSWQRVLWVLMFAAGMFLFVHVVLNNAAQSAHPGRSYTAAIAFFAIFGLASTAFWAYFRFRPERVATPSPA